MKHVIAAHIFVLFLALASSALAADGVKFASLDVQKILIAAEEMKFAYVDIQKILALSDVGKEAKAILNMNVSNAEIEKISKEKELKKLISELEKKDPLLEVERSAKKRNFEQKYLEYQQFINNTAEEIRAKNTELSSRIIGDAIKVVQDYGRKKGYLFIFFKNDGMLYSDDKVDVTDEILKILNAM